MLNAKTATIGNDPVALPPLEVDDSEAYPRSEGLDFVNQLAAYKWQYLWVFVLYAIIYAVIFRDILLHIGPLISGESVLNADELVPFFDTQSQLIDQLHGRFSELTNGYEFRVRYSILTTWMRQYRILPFALPIASFLSCFACFVAISTYMHHVLRNTPSSWIIRSSALSALFINLILLHAKITHFYTLIIGFNLFLVALAVLLRGLFLADRSPYKHVLIANLLIVLNPAVHYVILYLITFSIAAVWALVRRRALEAGGDEAALQGRWEWLLPWVQRHQGEASSFMYPAWGRFFFCMALMVGTALLPYAVFVKYFVLSGISGLSDTVPVHYLFIRNSSIPLLHQLSFDVGAIMDNFLFGTYVVQSPRLAKSFYFVLAVLPFVPSVHRRLLPGNRERIAVQTMGVILLLSIWASMGYAYPWYVPTAHNVLASLVLLVSKWENAMSDVIAQAAYTFIQILRFPHRFQFITFAVVALLMPIGLTALEERVRIWLSRTRYWSTRGETVAAIVCCTMFFLPLLSYWEYRSTLLSGNFAGFLSPYPVQRLTEVKEALDELPPGRVIMLPPSETQKRITDENGVQHKFIDKFYIYFLNKPSYYYGLTGDILNKNMFFLLLRALYYDDNWWLNIMRDLQVRYLVVNKEIGPSMFGLNEYLRGIESTLSRQSLANKHFLTKKFENDGFVLYELIDPQSRKADSLFVDIDWKSYICAQETDPQLTQQNRLLYKMSGEQIEKYGKVVSNSPPYKTQLDVYLNRSPQALVRPEQYLQPFTSNQVPSSAYFGLIYSMFNLLANGKYNYLDIIMPGPFDTVTGTFVGLPKRTSLQFTMMPEEAGRYALYMRGIFTKNNVAFRLHDERMERNFEANDGATVYIETETLYATTRKEVDVSEETVQSLSKRIPEEIMPVSYRFDYQKIGTVELSRGRNVLYMEKRDENPMIVEGVVLVPEALADNPMPKDVRIIPFQSLQ